MSTATLKKSLGDAGAAIDESHGAPSILREVMTSLAEDGSSLDAYQVTVATATLLSRIVEKATKLRSFKAAMADTGSAGDTDVEVQINGVAVTATQLTIDNTDTDGQVFSSGVLDVDVPADALVEIIVTAAPTAGVGLTATARLSGVTVEA